MTGINLAPFFSRWLFVCKKSVWLRCAFVKIRTRPHLYYRTSKSSSSSHHQAVQGTVPGQYWWRYSNVWVVWHPDNVSCVRLRIDWYFDYADFVTQSLVNEAAKLLAIPKGLQGLCRWEIWLHISQGEAPSCIAGEQPEKYYYLPLTRGLHVPMREYVYHDGVPIK